MTQLDTVRGFVAATRGVRQSTAQGSVLAWSTNSYKSLTQRVGVNGGVVTPYSPAETTTAYLLFAGRRSRCDRHDPFRVKRRLRVKDAHSGAPHQLRRGTAIMWIEMIPESSGLAPKSVSAFAVVMNILQKCFAQVEGLAARRDADRGLRRLLTS